MRVLATITLYKTTVTPKVNTLIYIFSKFLSLTLAQRNITMCNVLNLYACRYTFGLAHLCNFANFPLSEDNPGRGPGPVSSTHMQITRLDIGNMHATAQRGMRNRASDWTVSSVRASALGKKNPNLQVTVKKGIKQKGRQGHVLGSLFIFSIAMQACMVRIILVQKPLTVLGLTRYVLYSLQICYEEVSSDHRNVREI